MRIGIDARLYGPRVGGGGLGRYVEQLIQHLELLDQENEYIIFLRKENWDEYKPQNPRFKKMLAPWRWYTLAEQLHMPRLVHEAQLDLIHYPHFNVPLFAKTPFVVTIHDLNLLEYPKAGITNLDPIRFWSKYLGFRSVLKHALKKSQKIITVSETTRQAIIKRFKTPEDKIITTPLGFLRPPEHSEPLATPPTPYLLVVGNAYPHKNLQGLIAGFRDALREIPNLTLVLVGPEDRFREHIREHARRLEVAERIIFTGFVSDARLDALYRNATAYIMPSFLEGFGFPGLEAQARNCAVLASDLPVLHETLGTGARYFDPKNPYAISKTIVHTVNNPRIRDELKQAGFQNIKRFDWQKTAVTTLHLYKDTSLK